MDTVSKQEARGYSPQTLAFLGDGVYEALVRRKIVLDVGSLPSRKLHALAVEKVRASYQSAAAGLIQPLLTEEEADVFRRGRNACSSVPKSATVSDYRRATGLEALFGYLSLIGDEPRLEEIFEVVCNGGETPPLN